MDDPLLLLYLKMLSRAKEEKYYYCGYPIPIIGKPGKIHRNLFQLIQ
jgi:hypothetical protein